MERTDLALNYTYEVLAFYKNNDFEEEDISRIQNNIDVYHDILGGERTARRLASNPKPFSLESVAPPYSENYAELCRGETVKVISKHISPE